MFRTFTARLVSSETATRRGIAGYPVGLTIAPIMPVPQWQQEYSTLLTSVAKAVQGIERIDMTAELITHRFTPGSKELLLQWYPRTTLDLREHARVEKRTKFGGFKFVYPRDAMGEMRSFFESTLPAMLPNVHILYWT
jgi:spore photoproduct lyase